MRRICREVAMTRGLDRAHEPLDSAPAVLSLSKDRSGRTEALSITRDGAWLIARFATPHRLASWAIIGGGLRRAATVAWLRVTDRDLRPPVDERDFLRDRLAARGLAGATGLMTSCDLDRYVDVAATWGDRTARCIVTVGLGNALRAGDPPGSAGHIGPRVGTINLLCALDAPLADDALLEALALAAEARALAVREAAVPSQRTGQPSTGTGTDCIVIAVPDAPGGARYAGKHTTAGHLIGAAVHDAVARGVTAWRAAQEGAP
jgi:adenosylcobinamide amidohydrolase